MGACANILKLFFLACLCNQIYCIIRYPRDPSKLFHCKNGQYVASSDLCDDVNDCSDGSDEPSSCKIWNCGPGQFSCTPNNSNSTKNATCFNAKVLCDTRKDCADGFDEDNCGEQTNVQNCQLSDGKFLCKDNLRCLSLENVCNGICNCFDCSDENENCTKIDYQSLSKCPHSYFPMPLSSGPLCFCNSTNDAFQNLCKEIKDCSYQGRRCDQRCSQFKNRILCSCFENFIEVPVAYGFKCRSREYDGTRLIYSTANQIKSLNMTTKKVSVIKDDVQTKILAASANAIYYTTYRDMSKSIFLISKDGSSKVILNSSSPIISISVDYINNNVYFTTNQSLAVCSKNGEICIELKCCDVSYVVVYPQSGFMFYTKSADKPNERLLMRSSMDGSEETIFIDGTFRDIIPMAVDEQFSRLYWLESGVINSVSIWEKTLDKHTIRYNHNLKSFAILDEIIFYTSERDNKIYLTEILERFVKPAEEKNERTFDYFDRPPLDTNYTLHTDGSGTISIIDLKVYNSYRQLRYKDMKQCPYACAGLCVPVSTHKFTFAYHERGYLPFCICRDFNPSEGNQWCGASSLKIDSTSNDGFPFITTFFVLILLVAVFGGMYFIYSKYYSGVFYSRRSRDDRIYDPNQSEF